MVIKMRDNKDELVSCMDDVEQYIRNVAFDEEERMFISASIAKKFIYTGLMSDDDETVTNAQAALMLIIGELME
jgi:hypothetical protein